MHTCQFKYSSMYNLDKLFVSKYSSLCHTVCKDTPASYSHVTFRILWSFGMIELGMNAIGHMGCVALIKTLQFKDILIHKMTFIKLYSMFLF